MRVVGADNLGLFFASESCLGRVCKVGANDKVCHIFEFDTHVIIGVILDTQKGWNIDFFDSVDHGEEFLIVEALGGEKARVTLDLRRALHLDLCAILEHLSSHLEDCLAAVLLQLDERLNYIIFETADELLSGVAHRVNIVHLGEQVNDYIAVGRLLYSCFKFTFFGFTVKLDFFLEENGLSSVHIGHIITLSNSSLVALGSCWVKWILFMLVFKSIIMLII